MDFKPEPVQFTLLIYYCSHQSDQPQLLDGFRQAPGPARRHGASRSARCCCFGCGRRGARANLSAMTVYPPQDKTPEIRASACLLSSCCRQRPSDYAVYFLTLRRGVGEHDVYQYLLFDADRDAASISNRDMALAFERMYRAAGACNDAVAVQRRRCCACTTTATSAGGGVLSKSSAPKRSYTATVSSISLKSRGSHRSASIFCKTCMSPARKTGTPLPGALDMLHALSERYDLYITTNGNPISQPGRRRIPASRPL